VLAHRVAQRELAGRGELPDCDFGEDLVDRAEVELRVDAVAVVRALEHRLAVLRQHDDAGELAVRRGAVGDGLQRLRRRRGEEQADGENELDHLNPSAGEGRGEL
jgi:hypothetical protein